MKKIMEYGPERGSQEADVKPSATAVNADGRQQNDNISFTDDGKKVTADLKSYNSQIYTNLAKKLEEIKTLSDQVAELKEQVKQETREHIADLFSAADETKTRVVETVSFTMTLSAKPKATESYKYASILEELEGQLTPELITVLKALKEKFKSTTQKEASLKVAQKVTEGIWDSIVSGIKSFVSAITKWCTSYDKKLAKLKAEFAAIEAQPVSESVDFNKGEFLYSGSKSGKFVSIAPNPEYAILDDDGEYITVPVSGLTKDKPSFAKRATSWIVGESAEASYLIGGETYQIKGSMRGTSVEKGQKVLMSDSRSKIQVPYEILDIVDQKTEERFDSVKAALAKHNVKSLAALAEIGSFYINAKDLEDGTSGEWFYISKGAWAIGSSADRLSFTLLGEKINEAGEIKSISDGKKSFETTREVVKESFASGIFIIACPHISDVDADTKVSLVKGFNMVGDDSVEDDSVESAVLSSGVDRISDIPASKVLTVVTQDVGADDVDAKIWYQDGTWMTAQGPVRLYQVSESFNHVGKDFQDAYDKAATFGKHSGEQAGNTYPEFDLVSKWKSPKGNIFYIAKGKDGVPHLLDSKGSVRKDFDRIKSVSNMEAVLKELNAVQVPITKLSLAEEKAISETIINPEDAYPLVATMDDSELESFKARWDVDKRFVDSSTPEGRAYSDFGAELEDEAKERGM